MGIKQIDTSSTWRKNGGIKMKNIKENIKEIQRIQRLKDSLEMEYYKKQLGTYPYNHSEIKDTSKTSF